MEPLAWMNGAWAAERDTRLPLDDAMVTHGAGLVEVLRTWGGAPVFLERHLARFTGSCREMGLKLPVDKARLPSLVDEFLRRQGASDGDKDRHVVLLATPGSPGQATATLAIHGRPLDSALHAEFQATGARLGRTRVRAMPPEVAPCHWKHRNRLNWFLAGKPGGCLALLETAAGTVTETAIGHVVMVEARGGQPVLVSAPERLVLPGITVAIARELAGELGIPWESRPFPWEELARAPEAFLAGSGFGMAGVSRVGEATLPWPGTVTRAIQAAFALKVARTK